MWSINDDSGSDDYDTSLNNAEKLHHDHGAAVIFQEIWRKSKNVAPGNKRTIKTKYLKDTKRKNISQWKNLLTNN